MRWLNISLTFYILYFKLKTSKMKFFFYCFTGFAIFIYSCGVKHIKNTSPNKENAACVSGDCQNGIGKYRFTNAEYEGEWKNGLQNGKGKITMTTGDVYEGDFKDGKINGYGEFKSATQGWRYVGNWLNGDFGGKGFYVCPAGNTYDGNYERGHRNGYGIFTYKIGSSITKAVAGDKYIGEWKGDDYKGWGILIHKDGTKETGVWATGHKLAEEKTVQEAIDFLNQKYTLDLSAEGI